MKGEVSSTRCPESLERAADCGVPFDSGQAHKIHPLDNDSVTET